MWIKYQPEGQEKPREWEFRPSKVSLRRAEMIERRYTKLAGFDSPATFEQFRLACLQGSAAAHLVLLWHLLNLEHSQLKIEDVDALREELTVEPTKSELEEAREAVFAIADEGQRELAINALEAQIAKARDDGGKAPSKPSEPSTGTESESTSSKDSPTSNE